MSEVKTNKITSLASNNDITLDPDGTGDVVVASGHKLGVGTASPDGSSFSGSSSPVVDISGTRPLLILSETDSNTKEAWVGLSADEFFLGGTNTTTRFYTDNSERARLDTNGHLLVAQTSFDTANVGHSLTTTGFAHHTRDGNVVLIVNRKSSDGEILELRKNDAAVGTLGSHNGGGIYVADNSVGFRFDDNGTDNILPCNGAGATADNSIDLGVASARFDDIFATNTSIQTSDENEKQNIASLTTAEMTAAKAISKLFKTFKWQDKVAAKGDAARTHTGVIAQEVQTAMSDAGLDAADYAFWCSDTWTNDDGTSQTRLGVRYPELLAFVGAATEQRLADIETRLTALEAGE